MVKTITSKEINLEQLDKELGSHGLSIDKNDPSKKVISISDISPITQKQLEDAVAAHVAIEKVITLEEKLATVGLTLAELKAALA